MANTNNTPPQESQRSRLNLGSAGHNGVKKEPAELRQCAPKNAMEPARFTAAESDV
jgi:hypothetical protein